VTAEIKHAFHKKDVQTFADLSGDNNPLHLDADYAKNTTFGSPIVHGILCSSLFPTIFGSQLPGSVYVAQSMRFHLPVYVGETITAKIEVKEVKTRMRLLVCSTHIVKSDGSIAISGDAKVLLPKH